MELDEETVAELKDAIQELKTSFEEKLEEAGEEADKTINEILAILKQSIASDVLDGEDCAVITYTIDNEVIRALVEKLLEVSKVSESEKEAVRNELNLDEMDETVDIDLSFKVYISLADAFLLKESLTGTMTEKGSDAINTVDLTATFGEDKIALVGSITDEGETEAVEVTITKTVKESISTYTLTATSDIGGDVQTVTPLTYTYNQKARTFKLTLVMDDDEPSLTIKGGVTVKDKEAKIAITEIGTQGVSLELELALTFNADASVPTAPENAKDIVEMTEAQWKQVTAAIERSPLLQILEALFSTPEFDA